MTTLAVFANLRESYGFVAANTSDLARIASFPALIAVLLWTGLDWWESQGRAIPLGILVEIIYAWFAFFWHRRLLMGEEAASMGSLNKAGHGDDQSKWFSRYIIRAILYAGLVFLVMAGPIVIVAFQVAGFAPSDQDFARTLAIIIVVIAFYPLSAFFLRFVLMFPAIATGHMLGWGGAWRLSRGNAWRLATVFALAFLPFVPVFGLAVIALDALPDRGPTAWLLSNAVLATIMFALVAVETTCMTLAYRDLNRASQWTDTPDGAGPGVGTGL